MCAIVDANVLSEVFGDNPTGAGEYFYDWLVKPRGGILVVGGKKFGEEAERNSTFRDFVLERWQIGRARRIPDEEVDDETDRLDAMDVCKSDDEHILALARVSGARLLFTNDQDLQDDFRDRDIVGGTRGRIYTTREYSDVRRSHRDLLRRTDLCSG